MSANIDQDREHDDIMYPHVVLFLLVHAGCVAAIWSGVSWQAIAIGVVLYWLRMFAIGAGYHRYFSHRAYSTSRVFQFILAFLAQSSAQKSVPWWAAKHRHHHLHSDTEQDVHSPRHRGFVYSHVGWIFHRRHDATDLLKVSDFVTYPELMWLHRFEILPALAVAGLCFLVAGWSGLVVGFLWSTVLLYHATFCINSLAHVHGRTRYVTGDDSRNNWLLAVFTMGEGWHNNHHAYQSSARQGFRWWEIDVTYYVLVALSWLGIVWDMKTPPEPVLRQHVIDRHLNHQFRRSFHELLERYFLHITEVACVRPVDFLLKFLASNSNLCRVDDDDTIALNPMRGEGWFILTAQRRSDIGCKPAKHLAARVKGSDGVDGWEVGLFLHAAAFAAGFFVDFVVVVVAAAAFLSVALAAATGFGWSTKLIIDCSAASPRRFESLWSLV